MDAQDRINQIAILAGIPILIGVIGGLLFAIFSHQPAKSDNPLEPSAWTMPYRRNVLKRLDRIEKKLARMAKDAP